MLPQNMSVSGFLEFSNVRAVLTRIQSLAGVGHIMLAEVELVPACPVADGTRVTFCQWVLQLREVEVIERNHSSINIRRSRSRNWDVRRPAVIPHAIQ